MISIQICALFGNGYNLALHECNSNPIWKISIAVFFIFVVGEFIHAILFGQEESGNAAGVYDNPTAAIRGAEVIEINGHTRQINTPKGLSFLVKIDEGGTARMWKMKNGKTVGNSVIGAQNAWQFGKTQNESLAEYIKMLENQK